MQGQFLMMIASGFVGNDEEFMKLEAFYWRGENYFAHIFGNVLDLHRFSNEFPLIFIDL